MIFFIHMKLIYLLLLCYFCKLIASSTVSTIMTSCFCNKFNSNEPSRNHKAKTSPTDPILQSIVTSVKSLPISKIISNSYSFFYWLPRKNLLYDKPWRLFKNSTAEFLAYYQFPHNLPPYRYLDETILPKTFFCFGLPGNTLPLGNWDPWCFTQVSKKVVLKYRESEVKHGRLAMLGCIACISQEIISELNHMNINGLAITHLSQLRDLPIKKGVIGPLVKLLNLDYGDQTGFDYLLLMLFLCSFEIFALTRNWTRWKRNEYNHQFDHNIGIGNLRDNYENGNYGFDPLQLLPFDDDERRIMISKELNHGRLAMLGFIGIIFQEYFYGQPILYALNNWLASINLEQLLESPVKLIESFVSIPYFVVKQWSQNDFQAPSK